MAPLPAAEYAEASSKRIRLLEEPLPTKELSKELAQCQTILGELPSSLIERRPIRNDTNGLRDLLEAHGFRISLVSMPRVAVSVYKDSCGGGGGAGRQFLIAMLGVDARQETLEWVYATCLKANHCLRLFCERLRATCAQAMTHQSFRTVLEECEEKEQHVQPITSTSRTVSELIELASESEPRAMAEQLQREYDHIRALNSTLSNALLQMFTTAHKIQISQIFLKRSHAHKYERITIHLYDPEIDQVKPSAFSFLPCLSTVLKGGIPKVVDQMIQHLWSHMLKCGYYATCALKEACREDLVRFFSGGIVEDDNKPVSLSAHFDPTSPLAWYFKGKAGAGKSSLARNFPAALEAAVAEYLDPAMMVRFVKQNMNKPQDVLDLEFEIRPNNNDLSVMGIIQGRRLSLKQAKPGLVVLDFEEMPSNAPLANPNQTKVAQLMSQRLMGRKGDFQTESVVAPRNSDKRGIHGDMSLVTLFTSNYDLSDSSCEALRRLKMFEKLKSIEITPISGNDRSEFALAYLKLRIKEHLRDFDPHCNIVLRMNLHQGDIRPLVRMMRMISYFICSLVSDSIRLGGIINAEVFQGGSNFTISANRKQVQAKLGSFQNLYAVSLPSLESKVQRIMSDFRSTTDSSGGDLSMLLEYWLSKTLAPVVITSTDKPKIRCLLRAIQAHHSHCIAEVDASSYKMMKSLYDPSDTPNLRDDILKMHQSSGVAVELHCPTADAQLCIRELIEDSPSMTAFSTARSALRKSGLIFLVHVQGEISPEILSRTSLVI